MSAILASMFVRFQFVQCSTIAVKSLCFSFYFYGENSIQNAQPPEDLLSRDGNVQLSIVRHCYCRENVKRYEKYIHVSNGKWYLFNMTHINSDLFILSGSYNPQERRTLVTQRIDGTTMVPRACLALKVELSKVRPMGHSRKWFHKCCNTHLSPCRHVSFNSPNISLMGTKERKLSNVRAQLPAGRSRWKDVRRFTNNGLPSANINRKSLTWVHNSTV